MEASTEALEKYLPYYLSGDKKESLRQALRDFRDAKDVQFYQLDPETQEQILQGDVWKHFSLFVYHTGERKEVKGIVLSNTCDVAGENPRDLPVKLNFAPIIKLNNFIEMLQKAGVKPGVIDSKIDSIRRQQITNIFYLPSCNESGFEEAIVPLDDLHSVPVEQLRQSGTFEKLKSLSMFGFYLFTFKLSIHFCRLHEGVDRV